MTKPIMTDDSTGKRQIIITDDFFIGTVSEVVDKMLHTLHGNHDTLVDLSEVTRIDSAAIQAAMAAKKEAECRGVLLTFAQSETVKSFASSIGVSL